MNYWSIKEIADMLGVTIQAIYKYKDEYIEKGYIEKDQDGKYIVNLTGYNYFINKKKGTPGATTTPQVTPNNDMQKEYIDTLKARVEQLEQELQDQKAYFIKEIEHEREQVSYFKNILEQKERQINTYLLPGADEPPKKKSIFSLFR